MKKALIAFVLILLVLSLSVSTFALSYDGEEFKQTKYYSLIPWSEINYSDGSQTWRFAPYGSTYYRTTSEHGQPSDPSYAESDLIVVGWDFTGGEEPSPEQLHVSASQTYYSQASRYYANYVNYDFGYSGQNQNVVITLYCRNVHVTYAQWNALHNYCFVRLPGTSLFDLSVAINYYGVDTSTNSLASKNIYFEQQALVGDTSHKMFPSWEVFTNGGLDTFSDGYMIKDMVLTFIVDSYQGDISIGNLYYNEGLLAPNIPVFDKEVTVEKEVIVEVPEEELDLFSWLINPIEKFFAIEFFPGISLGGVAGVLVMILVALALIKLWGS